MAREMAKVVAGTSASTSAGTGAPERVEIVTRGEVRRSYTPEEKARLLSEAASPGARVSQVARRHGVCASLLHCWRRQAEGRPVRKMPRPAAFVPLLLEAGCPPGPPASAPAASGTTDAAIEVVLRNGRVLRVGVGTDAVAVARLAAALEA
jgi:transposase